MKYIFTIIVVLFATSSLFAQPQIDELDSSSKKVLNKEFPILLELKGILAANGYFEGEFFLPDEKDKDKDGDIDELRPVWKSCSAVSVSDGKTAKSKIALIPAHCIEKFPFKAKPNDLYDIGQNSITFTDANEKKI